MMDREMARQCFMDYVKDYDCTNPMISHKVTHTFHVADLAERIAMEAAGGGNCADFSWFLGLLHDIGRFEQVRQYGTFVDSQSVDHAQLGADILFKDGLIDRFPVQDLMPGWKTIAETAIRMHNQLALPEDMDEETRLFCQILRDADKIDIFRVVMELPFEKRIGKSKGLLTDTGEVSEEVMACVMEHRCVPRDARRSILDGMISHCCMAFELVYEVSRRLAVENKDLMRMLEAAEKIACERWGADASCTMKIVRREIEKSLGLAL
jgi:hypothetical protein